jgi:hypothetical protein
MNLIKRVDKQILRNTEKLVLLSQIEGVEFGKVKQTIETYLLITLNKKSRPKSSEDYDSLILTISKKVNLNKKKNIFNNLLLQI